MYLYIDCHGNEYHLSSDGQRLRYVAKELVPAGAMATQSTQEMALSDAEYMRLISAFAAAIDNRLQHRELCNKCSGTILATQDGQQRRYILSGQSTEMQDLEGALRDSMQLL